MPQKANPEDKDYGLTALIWWGCLVPSVLLLMPVYAYIDNLKRYYLYQHDLLWTTTQANLGLLEAIVNILLTLLTVRLMHKFLGKKIECFLNGII